MDIHSFYHRLILPKSVLSAAVAVCLLSANTLYAQQNEDQPPPSRSAVYLAPLVNIGEAANSQDPYTRPAASSTIAADRIDLLGGQNLDDALRTLPGIFTRDNVQNPGIAVNIRGLEGSNRVNMTVDGIRQNFRFVGHEAQGFVYVDTALLAGVDVDRGVISGVGGAGALAGRANFRTLGVEDILGERNVGGFVHLGYGNNFVGDSQALAAGARSGDWAVVAASSRRSPDDYKNGDRVKVAFTGQDLVSNLVKLQYQPNDSQRFNLGTVLYDNTFSANSYNQTIQSNQFSFNYAFTPSNNDWIDLRANLYRSDVTMRYLSPMPSSGMGPPPMGVGRVIRNLGNGFDVSNTSYFAQNVYSTYGVDYFRDDYRVKNSAATPERGVNGPGKSAIASVFSETTVGIGPVTAIAGLRYDRFTLKGHGSVKAPNPVGLPAGTYQVNRSNSAFSPKLTLAVQATDWLQPYASWGKSQRAPTISETFVGGSHPPTSGPPQNFFPNPFLKPEKMNGYEVGVNITADNVLMNEDVLRVKANYYQHKVNDYVRASMGSGTYFANVPGKSDLTGIELEGLYDAGIVFTHLSYADTKSKLPAQINGFGAQSYQPDEVLNATVGTRLLARKLTLGVRYFHTTSAFIGTENAWMGPPWEPGYELTDMFANYRFAGGLELQLSVSNIDNTAYNPALSTAPSGVTAKAGRGRTANMAVRFDF